MTCPSPAARQWTMAMLTASTDGDPVRFEIAQEATPEGAVHLASIAASLLRINAEAAHQCPFCVLADMGLVVARDTL